MKRLFNHEPYKYDDDLDPIRRTIENTKRVQRPLHALFIYK